MACGCFMCDSQRERFNLLSSIISKVMDGMPFEEASTEEGFTPEEAKKAFETEVLPMNAEAYRIIAEKLGW